MCYRLSGVIYAEVYWPRIAPSLMALFGERFTMQFMSQSTGWADNIILH